MHKYSVPLALTHPGAVLARYDAACRALGATLDFSRRPRNEPTLPGNGTNQMNNCVHAFQSGRLTWIRCCVGW